MTLHPVFGMTKLIPGFLIEPTTTTLTGISLDTPMTIKEPYMTLLKWLAKCLFLLVMLLEYSSQGTAVLRW